MQFEIETVWAMTTSVRTILKPYLMISYVFGVRTANLSNPSRFWFSVLYMLLVWSIYYFFASCESIISFHKIYPVPDNICYCLETFTTLWLIVFGIYHDKKFHNCLKKLDIVDDTLLQLGTMTNYDKLRKKAVWFVLGWFVMVILLIYYSASFLKDEYDRDVATAMFFIFLRDYSFHINFLSDLTTASILEYTGLKFDQVNEHLQNLIKDKKHEIKRTWENSMIQSRQRRFSKPINNKCILWIVTHLHLELRKVCCEIDSIFVTQMTIKMICYFGWIAIDLREIFFAILINDYIKSRLISVTLHLLWFCHNVFKILLINYMCEKVITKASVTAHLLNKLSYFICDVEIREIISQFLLRIVHAPLKFCGIGFFQFGYKFLYGFITSIVTVLIIIIQVQANK